MAENITEKDIRKIAIELAKELQIAQLSIKHGIDNLIRTETKDIQGRIERLNQILKENLDRITENFKEMPIEEDPELGEDNIICQKEQDLFHIEHQLTKEKDITALPLIADHQKEVLTDYLKIKILNDKKTLKQMDKQLKSLKKQSKMLIETIDAQENINEHLTSYKMELSSRHNEKRSHLKILDDKYERLKTLEKDRAKKLGELCEKFFPAADGGDIASTNSNSVIDIDMKSLSEILELLLNCYINFRHDPWVVIDETFWVGHINTLKRVGIIKTNPINKNLISLDFDM